MEKLPRKSLILLSGDITTPPLSEAARHEAGVLLRRLQRGFPVEMPHSRPMPSISERVHELRIVDESQTWRIIYRIDADAIVIAAVWSKKTPQTPQHILATCRRRYRQYDGEN